MLSRAALILLALFWVTMNVLLWRVEFGPRGEIGIAIPAKVVWRKILTAPDSSSLNVLYHGNKIGICHWATKVSEEADQLADKPLRSIINESNAPGYQIQFEGNMFVSEAGGHVRFDGDLKLAKDQTWQQINLRLSLHRITWKMHSDAAEKKLRLDIEDGDTHLERTLMLSDLQHPGTWISEFGGPFGLDLIGEGQFAGGITDVSRLKPRLNWTARDDTIKIHRALVRVYRLEAQLLDRYKIVIIVSHVGEILRVELPDNIILLHEQLGNA